MTPRYTTSLTETAIGPYTGFWGPGLSRHGNGIHLVEAHEAERLCQMLEAAYEAGRRDKARQIRDCLGIDP